MKKVHARLSARYVSALRAHLGEKHPGNGDRAQGLGRAALARGLVMRDLITMHHRAVTLLSSWYMLADRGDSSVKRSEFFLAQAIIPLETAQRDLLEANRHLRERNETLRLHTAALAKGNQLLQHEVTRRKAGELVIKKGQEKYRTLFMESHVMGKKLRQLTHQIISAQEDERKEISRELHDEVVQTLVGINVELAALGKGTSVGLQTLKEKIARTQRLVEHSVNAVHRFARELRPAVLDDLGLIPALHAYSKSLSERKKINIRMTAFGGVEALGTAKRVVLYRVAQEALTNVARHAHATQVRMSITEISGAIRMEISDNGKSFPVKKTLLAKNNKRLGLVGMRERVEMVGGKLVIESAPGKGTIVRAEIPFIHAKTKN